MQILSIIYIDVWPTLAENGFISDMNKKKSSKSRKVCEKKFSMSNKNSLF